MGQAAPPDNEETKKFGGSIDDPLALGLGLGNAMVHMMRTHPDLHPADTREQWVNAVLFGIASSLRDEIPVSVIASILSNTAAQIFPKGH